MFKDNFVLFYILLFLGFIALVVGLIYFSYWLPKKLGQKKLGIVLSGSLIFIIVCFILSIVFENELFFKSDAKKRLQENNIILVDQFSFSSINIDELSGITQFDLNISQKDKRNIIDKIIHAANYQDSVSDMYDPIEKWPRYSKNNAVYTANYKDGWNYIYEVYQTNKIGYAPVQYIISVSIVNNTLSYVRLD
jgi:hypothetical protein